MSRKLEELFHLPTPTEYNVTEDDLQEPLPNLPLVPQDTLSTLEKIEAALPSIRDLSADDDDLDELAELAKNQSTNLSDLGMQVDSRFSAEIFAVSSTLLGHAISAKTAKINKKLKQVDLLLKKAQLDQRQQVIDSKAEEKVNEVTATPLGTGSAMDRNELLRTLMSQADDKGSDKKEQN